MKKTVAAICLITISGCLFGSSENNTSINNGGTNNGGTNNGGTNNGGTNNGGTNNGGTNNGGTNNELEQFTELTVDSLELCPDALQPLEILNTLTEDMTIDMNVGGGQLEIVAFTASDLFVGRAELQAVNRGDTLPLTKISFSFKSIVSAGFEGDEIGVLDIDQSFRCEIDGMCANEPDFFDALESEELFPISQLDFAFKLPPGGTYRLEQLSEADAIIGIVGGTPKKLVQLDGISENAPSVTNVSGRDPDFILQDAIVSSFLLGLGNQNGYPFVGAASSAKNEASFFIRNVGSFGAIGEPIKLPNDIKIETSAVSFISSASVVASTDTVDYGTSQSQLHVVARSNDRLIIGSQGSEFHQLTANDSIDVLVGASNVPIKEGELPAVFFYADGTKLFAASFVDNKEIETVQIGATTGRFLGAWSTLGFAGNYYAWFLHVDAGGKVGVSFVTSGRFRDIRAFCL